MQIQHKDHNRPTLEVDHCFCEVKNLLSKTRLFITSSFHRFWNSSYFYTIRQRHTIFPILGLILLKLKHASNRPVYFRDLCAAYSTLPQKSSRIIFQHTYANLLSSKITHGGNLLNLLKQTTYMYLLLQAKNPCISIACVQTRHTIGVTRHMQ